MDANGSADRTTHCSQVGGCGWRVVSALSRRRAGEGSRYGTCLTGNPEYRLLATLCRCQRSRTHLALRCAAVALPICRPRHA